MPEPIATPAPVAPTPAPQAAPPTGQQPAAPTPAPAPVVETPAVPAPRMETAAERFARLARAETDYRSREGTLKQREAEVARLTEQARAESAAAAEFRRIQALAKTDPAAYLKAAGVDPQSFYRTMTDNFVEGRNLVPEAGPENEIALLKQEVAELRSGMDSRFEEGMSTIRQQREQEEQAARQAYESELIGHISDNRKTYPYIANFDLAWKVDEVIKAHEKSTGRILRVDTACRMVEDAYRSRFPTANTLDTATHAPVAPTPAPQAAPSPAPGLSNRMGAPAPVAAASNGKQSDVERALAKYAEVHAQNVAAGRYKQ